MSSPRDFSFLNATAPTEKGKTECLNAPAEAVADAFVEALSDPECEAKERKAQAEHEDKMRAALRAQGRLPEAKKP